MSFQELFPIQPPNALQWQAMIPLLAMSIMSIVALVCSPLKSGRFFSFTAFVSGCVISLFALTFSGESSIVLLDGTLVFDRISQVFSFIVVAAGLAAAIMSLGFDEREHFKPEYFPLMGMSLIGMMVLVSTRDLVLLFIALELLSLAVYILVSMRRTSAHGAEAGLKYFLLGGSASAILLYGVTLVYGSTGSLSYLGLQEAYKNLWQPDLPLLPAVGLGLIAIGFLFKIGAVPFHMWVPDVYMGAATPVTGFMISAVKAAAIGALLRFCAEVFALPGLLASEGAFSSILGVIIAATLIFGSFVGLRQQNLKRLFAYSTIAHTGYLLLGILALTVGQRPEAADAIASYTLFYAVMNIGGFAVLTQLSPRDDDEMDLKDLAGLGQRRPFMAFALSIFLLSMAGIPPTAGFFGKYYLFISAISAGQVALTVLAVLASVVSVVYYLRPLFYMYMQEQEAEAVGGVGGLSAAPRWFGSAAVVSLAVLLTLFMGLVPAWFSSLMQ